jgi:hypothetical protein
MSQATPRCHFRRKLAAKSEDELLALGRFRRRRWRRRRQGRLRLSLLLILLRRR